MNRNQIVVAALLAVAGTSAFAGGEFDPQTGFAPDRAAARSAADVRAETLAARRAGPLNVTRDDQMFVVSTVTKQTLKRADVTGEYLRARASGELVPFDTGDYYARVPATSTLTRQAVREQTRTALNTGRVANGS